jgi:hypothetical protein
MQKKAKPKSEFCLSDIRKHKVFEIMLIFALLQLHAIKTRYMFVVAVITKSLR